MGVGVGVGESVGMGVDGAGVEVARGVTVDNATGSVGRGRVGVGRVICGPQPASTVAASSGKNKTKDNLHNLGICRLANGIRIRGCPLFLLWRIIPQEGRASQFFSIEIRRGVVY